LQIQDLSLKFLDEWKSLDGNHMMEITHDNTVDYSQVMHDTK